VPFLRDSELAVLWGHVHEPPPKASQRNHDLPEAVDSVIARALAKNSEKRYETCADLTEAARDALGLRDVLVVRDRRPLLLAAVGVLVAAGAIAAGLALSLGGGGPAKASLAVTNNSLVRIDPQTNRVTAVTSMGRKLRGTIGPVGVSVGGPRVWVYNWDDATVSAIDPRTAEVKRTLSIGGSPPAGWVNSVAADGNGAWTISSGGGSGSLTHVGTGFQLAQQFRLGYDPLAIALGERDVWVAAKSISANAVLRVSRTGAVLARVQLPPDEIRVGGQNPNFQSVASGREAVWTAEGATIFRIDPATARITGKVRVPTNEVLQVAAGEEGVWGVVYGSGGNALVQIDPVTLRVKRTIRSPVVRGGQNESEASRVALASGAVWWIGGDSGIVWRVDPHTGKIVSTIRLTPPVDSFGDFEPFGIAAGAGGVWVTVTTAP
jgi:YVTN family beta-propeller protein